MTCGKILPFFISLYFLFSPHPVEAAGARELRVGVAVTPSFKSDPQWKEKFERRLAYASKIFQVEFKMNFTVAEYWEWPVADEKQESKLLLDDLMNRFPLTDVDMVIGLSRLTHAESVANVKDLDVLGRTQPFSGYVAIRFPQKELFKIQEETVLTHELGHLFGAIHTADANSIMAPIVQTQIPSAFDKVNRDIISLTRDMDFKKGMSVLDKNTAQLILTSYLKLMRDDQPFEFYYAIGNFYAKLGQDADALKALRAAQQLDRDNPRILYDLGVLYWKLGKTDDAINQLVAALPRFRDSEKSEKTNALKLLGGAYFQRKKYDAAYDYWSKALALNPKDRDLKVNLAVAQLQRGQLNDANTRFKYLLEQDPKNPKVLSNLGSAYYQMGNYKEAVKYMEQTLALLTERKKQGAEGTDGVDPYDLLNRLGYAYTQLKRPSEALSSFKTACDMKPSIDCHKRLGQLYYQQSMWDDAIREFTDVLKVQKDDANAYGILGVSLSNKGDTWGAVKVFQVAVQNVRERKTQAAFQKNLGHLYMQLEQADLALKAFQQSIALDWNNAESHFGLALVYLAKNREVEAKESLKTSLRLNPNNTKAQEILAKLQSMKV